MGRAIRILLFNLLASGAVLECLALGYGLYLDVWDFNLVADPQLGWIPNQNKTRGGHRVFDRFGTRHPMPLSDNTLLLLGDSVTHGNSLFTTFAEQLKAINASVPGYSTMQERDWFRRDVAPIGAKSVGLVICINDIMTEQENQRNIAKSRGDFNLRPMAWFDFDPIWRVGGFLWERYHNHQVKPSFDLSGRLHYRYTFDQQTWQEWLQAIRSIRAATGENSTFFLVLAPPAEQVAAVAGDGQRFWLNDQLAIFAETERIPLLDLLPALARLGPETLYIDDVHFSQAGHNLVAATLAPFVASLRDQI